MTDLLTKEERDVLERIRSRTVYEESVWEKRLRHETGISLQAHQDRTELLAIIDNLSKRGVKKYSEEGLQELCHKRLDERIFGNDHLKWRSFEIYLDGWVEFARFLGVLEEK